MRRLGRSAGLALWLLLASSAGPEMASVARAQDRSGEAAAPYAEMMTRGAKLLSEGKADDATFWFYAGQLRYRSYLTANPQLDPSGAPAFFASLMEVAGRPINEHAFGDVPRLAGILDDVLEWDAAQPDPALPAASHRQTRAGLAGLRDQILRDAATIRAERSANGLPNR